jgi:stress response protein SCP2
MAAIGKGETGILDYSKTVRHRICAGISWDPIEEAIERPAQMRPSAPDEGESIESRREFTDQYGYDIKPEIGEVTETFDVDLVCLVFNAEGELVDAVSPMDGEEVDQSGKIYHSGDERHGASTNDDEIISVELKGLPDYAHHLVFLAIIQSGHDYAYVVNPQARIYDSMSNKDLLKIDIAGPDSTGSTAYIICRVFRGEGEDEWMVHNISEFRVDQDIEDWAEEVKAHLN